jgi:hypothetical protein
VQQRDLFAPADICSCLLQCRQKRAFAVCVCVFVCFGGGGGGVCVCVRACVLEVCVLGVCVRVCVCVCVCVSECACMSVCLCESACVCVCVCASECVGVCESVCVSVFLLITFVQWLYCLTAHFVPLIFRNAASCSCTPGLYLGPKKGRPVLTVHEAGWAPATVSTLE